MPSFKLHFLVQLEYGVFQTPLLCKTPAIHGGKRCSTATEGSGYVTEIEFLKKLDSTTVQGSTVVLIVADEIRKLAEESSTQGKQIAITIKETTDMISNISDTSAEAEAVLHETFTLVKKNLAQIEQIVLAMREQARGSESVLSALGDINMITMEVKDGSTEMLSGGEQIAAEMRRLDELSSLISASMNEMASGTVQINNAVYEVNDLSQMNREKIESLAKEVSQFKV